MPPRAQAVLFRGNRTYAEESGIMAAAFSIRSERDVARARQFVLDECLASGLRALCDDAALLTSELVTNAMRYADQGPISVRAQRDGDHFVVQVLDGSLQEPRLLANDPWSEQGRGLTLVDALAEDWGVAPHPSGKVVWFRL